MDANLVEIFSSVQGEGPDVGASTLFVRLGACDLRCRWCDSPHTWRPAAELPQAPAVDWEDTGHAAGLAGDSAAEVENLVLAAERQSARDEDLIVVEQPAETQPAVAAEPVRRHEYRQLFRRLRGDQR